MKRDETITYTAFCEPPLGRVQLASDGEHLTGLWFEGQKYFADGLEKAEENRALPVFSQTEEWLCTYFSGQEPDFLPPLCPQGSPFRQEVWALLLKIPYGETTTYAELARELAARKGLPRMSAQAVGGAVAHNRISILIPCHRVVGSDGSLTGYAGGLERKVALLTLEQTDRSKLYTPKKGTAL